MWGLWHYILFLIMDSICQNNAINRTILQTVGLCPKEISNPSKNQLVQRELD